MKYKTFNIITYGCQMNQSDSERFTAYLENLGLKSANHFQKADIIVINSCSVRQKAEDKINGVVKNIRSLTQEKSPVIILTGCIARRIWNDEKAVANSSQKNFTAREVELKKRFKEIDLIVETKNFSNIASFLGIKPKFNDDVSHYLSFKPSYKSTFQAYVPISTGCNHFCTFCIVPFARGKEVCRDAQSIIREVFELVQNGYKDITLLGQTVNRWINPMFTGEFNYNEALTRIEGLNKEPMDVENLNKWRTFFELKLKNQQSAQNFSNLKQPRDFLQLIQVLDQIPAKWWTTWISSHPNYMTNELIDFVASSSKSMLKDPMSAHQRPYLHFALQSGNNRILKRMNRRYTIEEFSQIVKRMDERIEYLNLSTDIIVGFIDETQEEFSDTLLAEKNLKFDMIYISEYSPRKGTASERIKDKIPLEVKAQRKVELNEVLKSVAIDKNKKYIGRYLDVLCDGIDRKSKCIQARSANNKLVRINNIKSQSYIGEFIKVKITGCTAWNLEAEL